MPPDIPPLHVWNWIVRRYTERSLTYGSDKLPALSGIANFFGPKLDGQYLAGIWQNEDFSRQLAWYVDLKPSDLQLRPDYRAPTWSWASVDGPVRFAEPRQHYKPMIKLIQAEVTPSGNDRTGAVKHGFLLVEGSPSCIPANARESILKESDVKFDVTPEPVGDLYLLPLYRDAEQEYHGRGLDTVYLTYYTQYLLLIPHELDSLCFKRCGYAVPKRPPVESYSQDTIVRQIKGHSQPEKGYIFRII